MSRLDYYIWLGALFIAAWEFFLEAGMQYTDDYAAMIDWRSDLSWEARHLREVIE